MKTAMRALFALAVLAVGATTQLSCSVNDYCLNCATGDGGMGDGGNGDADDGGTDDDALTDAGCIPSGAEECDGKDNDCNGLVDDGVLPMVGDLCPNQMGQCAGGVYECANGALQCTKTGSPETCNGLDDNCNGTPDEGDPGGGGKCGTDMGECVAGQYHCNAQTGMVECMGYQDHTGDPELCDAKDNDCDGNFDENIGSLGNCGPTTNNGECTIGSLMCQGGSQICVGAVFPKFETCNDLDDDCDTQVDEIFFKQTDPANCGTCGNKCAATSKTCINSPVATVNGDACTMDADCQGGTCVVNSQPRCVTGGCTFACNAGFHNENGVAADGCEYQCFASGAEECDGIDNDCDGDTDEGVTPPSGLCLSGGECGVTAPTPTCSGAGGWTCTYAGDVQFPETKCDGKNNDCDANIDEGQPNLDDACDNGEFGVCKTTGVYVCNTADLNGPAVCDAPASGTQPSPEACDNVDNDCDNLIDEGGNTGDLIGQEWVDVGGGVEMMKYEASKPDSSTTDQGTRNTIACSKPGVKPWTNITYPQAAAACAAVGATLCSEPTWHRACSVITGNTYPLAVDGAGTLIEAEDYSGIAYATSGGVTRSWVPDYTAGFSGISALEATPNTGASIAAADALTQSPRVDYLINFTASGSYNVWVRTFSNKDEDDRIRAGIAVTPGAPTRTQITSVNGAWDWVDLGTFSVPVTGNRTVSIYIGDDGVKIDQIYIVMGSGSPPSTINSKGNKWAFAANPNTYVGSTCNGDDYDTDSVLAGDQDDILTTGNRPSCYSQIGNDVFDMSGNVKEWTLAHAPGENPIRGGASNNTGEGISCPLNFTLADDSFFFPNIGFRCCR